MSVVSWEAYYERQQAMAQDYPDVRCDKYERRRTRLPRKCHNCSKLIPVGSEYVRHFAIVDEVAEWNNYCSSVCAQWLRCEE